MGEETDERLAQLSSGRHLSRGREGVAERSREMWPDRAVNLREEYLKDLSRGNQAKVCHLELVSK